MSVLYLIFEYTDLKCKFKKEKEKEIFSTNVLIGVYIHRDVLSGFAAVTTFIFSNIPVVLLVRYQIIFFFVHPIKP